MRYFYVIGPVGSDPSFAQKRSILEQLGRQYDLEPFFPLDRHSAFSVGESLAQMEGSQFVLADLSLERPSCYFELGLARAMHLPVEAIAAVGTPIHQVGDSIERAIRFYSDLSEYRSAISQLLLHYGATRAERQGISLSATKDM